jgi:4,5-DOPA dioxygenase extradiol
MGRESIGVILIKMPTLFLAHGSPMNAISDNSFTQFLSSSSRLFPKPEAILVISAHWETHGIEVLSSLSPRTIHDFGGFPEELYRIQYPAKGDLELSEKIERISSRYNIQKNLNWGLDHGAWSVLIHMFPKADVPVLQLSINQHFSLRDHFTFSQELRSLREEGVLILGSGNVTHNLRKIAWEENASPFLWAIQFDELIKNALMNKNEKVLLNEIDENVPFWRISHPTLDHFIPLLYAYGASDQIQAPEFIFEGFQMGSLSMRSVLFH